MAPGDTDGAFGNIYEQRIGTPRTDDEVRGYWIFAAGLILGVLGILLFLVSVPATIAREWSIAVGAAGLALLIAGPVIRLPLQQTATYAVYLGVAVCTIAIFWFFIAFPDAWSVETGNRPVITLYAIGIAIIGAGGILYPLLTEAAGMTAAETEAEEAVRDRETAVREAEEARTAAENTRSEADKAREGAEEARAAAERDATEARVTAEEEAATREEAERGLAAVQEELSALEQELASLRDSNAQFELYEDRGGEHRWRLRHRNGNVIASSGQGYTQKHNAQKGLRSVSSNALGADIVHADAVTEETGKDALEEVPVLDELAEERRASFEVYEDNGGEYRWRLVHDNGNILADSGEGYASKSKAERAIGSVKRNVGPADYLRFDPASFEIHRDTAGEWRWRLVHENGNVLADSGEGYTRRRDARRALERVREGVADAEVEELD